MKDHRGKLLRSESNYIDNGENYFGDNNYFPEFPCRKHPASSSSSSNGGICAYCLNDRLSQLVCPDCGEQRISSYGSCSCSRNFTDNNTEDVSGRISVLLENDHHHHHQKGSDQIYNSRSRMGPRSSNFDEFDNTHFQRSYSVAHTAQSRPSESSSSSSGTGNKFWKIGKLFRKKKDHNKHNQNQINEENNYGFDSNHNNNSRTSFRGFYDSNEDQNYGMMNNFPVSSSAARASSVSTGNFVLDSAKISCFSESEARFSNFEYCSDTSNFIHPNKINNNIFSSRETEFVHSDDQAYIDLKLPDMSTSSSSIPDFNTNPPNLAAMKRNRFGLSTREFGYRGENGFEHQMYNNGGGRSCRISSVGDRDLRKCRKSYKVWKWFSKHHNNQNDSDKFDDHHRDFNL
ncbi:unnamed protein product [Amaranthus hypochondriacus]